ncbi:response regulator [Chthonobacter rhizosphaerae]|uniref:response regulator n=1 Tax=Chthonobacter rhizosphaerae TaxID=2735553 RepID=UPI0015EE7354|nr:response regulator transcription factor [Chthonobacter rhizosphaerae]
MSGLAILLVDDHPVVREGYRRLIERQPGLRVVAEAETAAEAYEAYRRCRPDVTILDMSLPGAGGLEAIRHIRQWDKGARILVFTMHQSAAFAVKAFEAGALGYITKTSPPSELIRAVEAISRGGHSISADIAAELAAERLTNRTSPLDGLGVREAEILRMFAAGMETERIAAALNLSLKTVQNYHYQIKAKTGARTDAHLVWMAISAGLLADDCPPQ